VESTVVLICISFVTRDADDTVGKKLVTLRGGH
jgi:hypothetical protein